MTTLVADGRAPIRPTRPRVHRRDLLRAELTKFRSVRSTYWTIAATAVATIGIGLINTATTAAEFERHGSSSVSFDATAASLAGLLLGQLAIGVLGVVMMTSEYSTGLIRTSATAVPRRRALLLAKAGVLGAVAFGVGLVVSALSFVIGQVVLARHGLADSITDPGALRAVLGAGFYVGIVGLVGFGLGAVIRRTAGAIVALVGLVFLLPSLLAGLPMPWGHVNQALLPSAGQVLTTASHQPGLLMSVGGAVALCLVWATVSVGVATWRIGRGDA